jgi:hypothetical protein
MKSLVSLKKYCTFQVVSIRKALQGICRLYYQRRCNTFQVIGIIFGFISIVPILKFIYEDSITRTKKIVYPIIGIESSVLCFLCLISS